MNAVQLVFVLLLLGKHSLCQLKFFVELGMQIRIMQNFSQNISVHPAKVGLQPPDLFLGTFELPGMGV